MCAGLGNSVGYIIYREDTIEFFFKKFPETKYLYNYDRKLIVKRGNLLNEVYNVYAIKKRCIEKREKS